MMRWLGLVLVLALGTPAADAQVFKPKGKKTEKAEKKQAAEPKAAKKPPRAGGTPKKRVTTKPKKTTAADRSRPEDLTPEPASKESDKDYVKIWDDDVAE